MRERSFLGLTNFCIDKPHGKYNDMRKAVLIISSLILEGIKDKGLLIKCYLSIYHQLVDNDFDVQPLIDNGIIRHLKNQIFQIFMPIELLEQALQIVFIAWR